LPIDNSNRRTSKTTGDYYDYGNSFDEIHLHNGEFLHNIGLRGSGMQIALLDNGFNNYTSFDAFDSVNANNQVLGTWDFVAREQNVSDDGSHGMSCFNYFSKYSRAIYRESAASQFLVVPNGGQLQ
jgi:hypothetical protein